MFKKSTVIFFALSLICAYTYPQSLLFNHLGTKEGLSQLSVNAIYQDEFEQIWIATRDGLNRYDGNKIESFRPIINDTTGIFGNNIEMVTGDKQGKIFLQCLSGLVTYDLRQEKFEVIKRDSVRCISYGKTRLWIGNENKIDFLIPDEKKVTNHLTLDSNIIISAIMEGSSGNLYVGTLSHGLFEIDSNGKSQPLISNIRVVTIYEDKQKRIWIGSLADGLFCIETQQNIKNYSHNRFNSKSISDNFVRAICQDDLGFFWIGTGEGLNHFNPESKEFENYIHSDFDIYSISNEAILSIQKDMQGSIWIGTYSGGVDIINPEYSLNNYYRTTNDNKSLNSSIVSNIVEDKTGNLWIGTDNAGLNYFDNEHKIFTYYTHNPSNANSLSSNIVKSTLMDTVNDCLWIGTNLGGLDRLDLKTRKINRIKPNKSDVEMDIFVRSLVQYKDQIILGTHQSIQVYDPKLNTIKYLLEAEMPNNNKQIWDMMVDSNSNLWFSISKSTFCYNFETKILKKILYTNPLAQNIKEELSRATFYEDSKKRIWIGTVNRGLGVYNTENESIVFFNTNNSKIIDDYILDINESPMGYLLIATNKGLSRLDVEKSVFSNYYNNQFFPFEAFNERSVFVSKSGNIVLSSLSGMLMLSERDFILNTKECRINLTAFRVNNKLIKPNDESDILKESILNTNSVILGDAHSVFSIEFAISNYIKSLQPYVQYKLEGFDKEWIDVQYYNIINYTNLDPGNYKLKIRGLEESMQYMMPQRELEIIIKAPFYKTGYAYLFYFLCVAGMLYLIISQIKLRESLKYAHDEKKHIEELNQYKLRFFTNISHEIRTPITLIISQLEMLLKRNDILPPIQSRLVNISKNASSLKNLITELLDFRKQNQGYTKLHASEMDIIKYLEDIFNSFKDFANHKQINTFFIHQENDIDVWFDSQQLHKVFSNLLSNAFKFTPSNGFVSLAVKRLNDQVTISVTDSGIGIKKDDIEKLFERFYQGENTSQSSVVIDSGTGIGLALAKSIVEAHSGNISVQSSEDKGSVFTVFLPLGDMHLTETEKVPTIEHSSDFAENSGIEDQKYEKNLEDVYDQIKDINISILIIEDSKELLQILVELFQPIYKVYTAIDGKVGFEKAIELKPDLILSDIMMPEMSGIELCKKIKTNVDICHIPVVLLTARTEEESNVEGLMIGADDYITKPFSSKILMSRCNSLINNRILMRNKFMRSPDIDSLQLATNFYDQQLLDKAIKIIENNISNPNLDVAFFAEKMCMSRSSLFSKLKGLTGQTPRDLITNIRLKKSQKFLNENLEMSITDIAFKLGFNDASYFIKVFKQNFGITPNQFRQNYLRT